MIYGIEYGQRDVTTDPVTFYGAGGYPVDRTRAIKFFDRVEAEDIVRQCQGTLPGDKLYSEARVIVLDATLSRDSKVAKIIRYVSNGDRHTWMLEYDNGQIRVAEMVKPEHGCLTIQVGHSFVDHCWAVKNRG